MLHPARNELQIIRYRSFERGDTLGPPRVQLSVGPAKGTAVPCREFSIPIMIVLICATAFARPARVVLAPVDLDVHVRRDAKVQSTDTLDGGLLLEPDARVAKPQPHKGLTVRIVERTDQREPTVHPLRGASEHCSEPSRRPAFVPHDCARTRDRDVPRLKHEHREQGIVERHAPPRGVLFATGVRPVHTNPVARSQSLAPLTWASKPTRVLGHRDVHVIAQRHAQSVGFERRDAGEAPADAHSANRWLGRARHRVPTLTHSENAPGRERAPNVGVAIAASQQVASPEEHS